MRARLRQVAWVLGMVAGVATLSGCVVAPTDEGDADYGYTSTTVYTHYGYPPPAPVEYRTMAPSSLHVWIDGNWIWGGSRYNWQPGYWVAPGFRSVPPPHRPVVRPLPKPRPSVGHPQARQESPPQSSYRVPPSGQRSPEQYRGQQRLNAPQADPNGDARWQPMERSEAGATKPIRSDSAQPDGRRPRSSQRTQDRERREPLQRRDRNEERIRP